MSDQKVITYPEKLKHQDSLRFLNLILPSKIYILNCYTLVTVIALVTRLSESFIAMKKENPYEPLSRQRRHGTKAHATLNFLMKAAKD